MARVIHNFIDIDVANQIKQQSLKTGFVHSGYHPQTNKLQWQNSPLYKDAYNILHPYLERVLGKYKIDKSPNYQRCYEPFGIHHDSKKRHSPDRLDDECTSEGLAILIPMDTGEYFNTVFWKEKHFDTKSMVTEFRNFSRLDQSKIKNSGIGDKYDLDFCWSDPRPGYQYYNHLTLDCVFNWRIGDAALFDRTQLHAASDFRQHSQYKDAITIFFE